MEASYYIGRRVHEIREVVSYPKDLLPRARCYVLLADGNCLEVQEQNPYTEKLTLNDCQPSDWMDNSIVSLVSDGCRGRTITDVIRSELFASIGLLLEGANERVVLYLGGCSVNGQRAEIQAVDDGYFEPGDMFSWLDGKPIPLSTS